MPDAIRQSPPSIEHTPEYDRVGGRDGAADGLTSMNEGWTQTHLLVLAAVLLLGILVRLHAMTAFPFDQDELYTLMESRDLFETRLKPGIEARPLYYLLQHPFLVFSQSEVALRVLPTLFGVLGLVVTAIAATQLVGPVAGIGALTFAALSPWHLYASSTARYFSLVYLLSAILVWRLPAALESERPRDMLLVLAVLITGTATHPSFVIAAAGLALALTLVRNDGRVGWYWPTRSAWMWLWLPYLAFLAFAVLALKLSGNESAVQNWSGRGLAASLRLVPAIVEWATLPVVAMAAAGGLLLLTAGGAARRVGVMAIGTVVVTLLLLVALSFRTDVYADYAIGMLPIAFVAAGGGVQVLMDRLRGGRAAGAALLIGLVVAGALPSTISFLLDGMRFDYRSAFARIAREAPNDPVFTWPIAIQRRYAPRLDGRELYVSQARRDAILDASERSWVVVSSKRQGIALDDDGSIAAWLADRCRPVERYERPRFDYRLYRVELWRCDRSW